MKNFWWLTRIFEILLSLAIFIVFLFGIVMINQTSLAINLFAISLISNYLYTAFLSFRLFYKQNKSNVFTNFYLFVFILLPFFSNIVYNIFFLDSTGSEDTKKFELEKYKYMKYEDYSYSKHIRKTTALDQGAFKVLIYNYEKYGFPIYNKNKLSFLFSPLEHLMALIELIESAKKFIHLQYYIFKDGHILNYLLILLEKKIQAGIEIKLLVDDWGNFWSLKTSTRKRIVKMGIQLKFFNPIFSKNKTWWQFRNHNKIVIVDNEKAIYGSCNISDEYFNLTTYFFQTTEFSIIVEGKIINSLNILFCSHWNMYDLYKQKKHLDMNLQAFDYLKPSNHVKEEGLIMQFVNSSPLMEDVVIKNNLLQLIYGAKKSITITTPYFFPPKDMVDALKLASISGIKIKVLVPKQADFANFFRTIHHQLYFELLSAKIEIYEFFGFNHEKIMLIDDDITYFGSYNWDFRALFLNFESALLIHNESINQRLSKNMQKQLINSQQVKIKDFEFDKLGFRRYMLKICIRLLKPFL